MTLSAENRKMLYIPEKIRARFITLEDDTEVFYQMSEFLLAGKRTRVSMERPVLRHPFAY